MNLIAFGIAPHPVILRIPALSKPNEEVLFLPLIGLLRLTLWYSEEQCSQCDASYDDENFYHILTLSLLFLLQI